MNGCIRSGAGKPLQGSRQDDERDNATTPVLARHDEGLLESSRLTRPDYRRAVVLTVALPHGLAGWMKTEAYSRSVFTAPCSWSITNVRLPLAHACLFRAASGKARTRGFLVQRTVNSVCVVCLLPQCSRTLEPLSWMVRYWKMSRLLGCARRKACLALPKSPPGRYRKACARPYSCSSVPSRASRSRNTGIRLNIGCRSFRVGVMRPYDGQHSLAIALSPRRLPAQRRGRDGCLGRRCLCRHPESDCRRSCE